MDDGFTLINWLEDMLHEKIKTLKSKHRAVALVHIKVPVFRGIVRVLN